MSNITREAIERGEHTIADVLELMARAESAERACAAMRDCLEACSYWLHPAGFTAERQRLFDRITNGVMNSHSLWNYVQAVRGNVATRGIEPNPAAGYLSAVEVERAIARAIIKHHETVVAVCVAEAKAQGAAEAYETAAKMAADVSTSSGLAVHRANNAEVFHLARGCQAAASQLAAAIRARARGEGGEG